jgi:hypothetical protein
VKSNNAVPGEQRTSPNDQPNAVALCHLPTLLNFTTGRASCLFLPSFTFYLNIQRRIQQQHTVLSDFCTFQCPSGGAVHNLKIIQLRLDQVLLPLRRVCATLIIFSSCWHLSEVNCDPSLTFPRQPSTLLLHHSALDPSTRLPTSTPCLHRKLVALSKLL